jgi:hypothetical protein
LSPGGLLATAVDLLAKLSQPLFLVRHIAGEVIAADFHPLPRLFVEELLLPEGVERRLQGDLALR